MFLSEAEAKGCCDGTKGHEGAKQAQTLFVWLESLELPTRVLGALRRDLEVIIGEWEGEDSGGVLAGFDQARYIETSRPQSRQTVFYRSRNGLVTSL